MSCHTRAPVLPAADDSAEASAVENSLRGSTALGRDSIPTDLFSRPLPVRSNDAYAFAATPDSVLPVATLPPHQAGWHSPRVAVRIGHPAAAFGETPGAGPSTAAFQPPRIERQAPTSRMQAHSTVAPLPAFVSGANLFTRPPTASTAAAGVSAFGSPTEASLSSSFSFAPRTASSLFALPTAAARNPPHPAAAQAALPPFAASHTPIRSARPTTATTHVTTTAAHSMTTPSPSSTNLDAAALAAERRIREARAVRAGSGEEAQRRVSFSPTVSTPRNNAVGGAYAAPPPPNRVAAAGAAAHRQASGVDSSMSHLGNQRFAPRQQSAGYADPSFSLSTDSRFARPTATRLFPSSTNTADPQRLFASTARTTQPNLRASEPEPEAHSTSCSAENTSTHSASTAQPPPTVRLRKWDGSQVVVPAYLVSDSAETVLEEQQFDHDVLTFDVGSIAKTQADNVSGLSHPASDPKEGEVDAVLSILEIQLGLRGLHGWYGHTYRNRPANTDGRTSRKRRRSTSSSPPPSASASDSELDPIIVYDTFGRVRGHVTLPNYTTHGGPPLPLPSPFETFSLRHDAASSNVLKANAKVVAKEQSLMENVAQLKEQWRSLRDKSSTVRSERFMSELKAK
ncbi:hypothetical protein, partial [Sporisorium scitamineum]